MRKNDLEIQEWLKQRKAQSLYRSTRLVSTPQQPVMVVDGQEIVSFCSNDYLGMANHPEVIKAFSDAASRYGVGAGASHLVSGHSQAHAELEQALAEFTGRDAVLLFSTGYMANLGVVSALIGRGDSVFQDRLNHASLIDAGLLSGAKVMRYKHNDLQSLAGRLAKDTASNKMILSDGVFSMDGDMADVSGLVRLSQEYKAWCLLDDAHGFGVLGKKGAGLLEHTGASQQDVPLLMATLGKAVGVAGAFIAGSFEHIELLKQLSRTWIYTTAMPPAIAVASRKSLLLIQREDWRREKLVSLITLFKQGARERNIQLLPSDTAIQPVFIGDNQAAVETSDHLLKQGIWVTAIRPPTVPPNTARLRVTLSAIHTEMQVNRLLDTLAECLKQRD